MELRKAHSQRSIFKLFSVILFIGCSAFVAIRGYKCFEKYLKNPEGVSVSYILNDGKTLPSFTFCLNDSDTYDQKILKECQINITDYIDTGRWVGNGSLNCTDPRIVYNQAIVKLQYLGIESINVKEFGPSPWRRIKDDFVNWNVSSHRSKRCFTFTIPENILNQGLSKLNFESGPYDRLFIHTKGLLGVEMFGAQAQFYYKDIGKAKIQLERIEMLQYNGKPCNDDPVYRYDECIHEHLYKVKSISFSTGWA